MNKDVSLFEFPANSIHLNALKSSYNARPNLYIDLTKEKPTVHTVAHLMMDYIESLPQSLIYTHLREAFRTSSSTKDILVKLRQYRSIIQKELSQAHKATLVYILQFLKKLSRKSSKNGLKLEKLAAVWGPKIFGVKETDSDEAKALTEVTKLLIDNVSYVSVEQYVRMSRDGTITKEFDVEDEDIVKWDKTKKTETKL